MRWIRLWLVLVFTAAVLVLFELQDVGWAPSAIARACDANGDGNDDGGILVHGQCSLPNHGPEGPRGPAPGPRNGTYTEQAYTPPCSDPPDGALSGIDCRRAKTCPKGQLLFWLWERQVVYADGRRTHVEPWHLIDVVCRGADRGPGVPPTTGQVLEEIKRVGLPAATPHIQPPGGRTVVDLDTIFYTRARPFTTRVTVVGQPVAVRAAPEAYVWHFGDGSQPLRTTSPGHPYPSQDVTYRYAQRGVVSVDVDVVYHARYAVTGGPWTDIPDPIPVRDGAAQTVEVVAKVDRLKAAG